MINFKTRWASAFVEEAMNLLCWWEHKKTIIFYTMLQQFFTSSCLQMCCPVRCEIIEMWRFKCWVPLMSETAAFRQTLITPPAQLWHHIPGKLWELICTLNGGSFSLSSFLRALNVMFIYDSIGIKMYAFSFAEFTCMAGWLIYQDNSAG